MAIKVIDNQPIHTKFACPYTCDESQLTQIVQRGDTQAIQTKCSSAATPTAYNSGWSVTGGITTSGGGSILNAVGAGTATHAIAIASGKRYQVKLTVQFSVIDDTGGIRIKINNKWLKLADASGGSYSILSGTFTYFISITTASFFYMVIETAGADTECSVSAISFGMLSEVGMRFLDANKSLVVDLGDTYTILSPDSDITNAYVIWSLLNNYPEGIYYVQLYDIQNSIPLDYITNGDFPSNITGWTQLGGSATIWTWSGTPSGHAQYGGTGTGSNETFAQSFIVEGGMISKLSLTLLGCGVGEGLNAYFVISGVAQEPVTLTADGIYTDFITLDLSNYSGPITVWVVLAPLNSADTFSVYDVKLVPILDNGNISNPFNLKKSWRNSILLTGVCNQQAYGFDFETLFNLSIRIQGELKYSGYPDTTQDYTFSDEQTDIINSVTEKNYDLNVDGVAEYIHDTLRVIRLCDEFLIDYTNYSKVGEYKLKPVEEIHSAGAVFKLKKQTGIATNYYES